MTDLLAKTSRMRMFAGPNGSDVEVLAIAHALERELARNPGTSRPRPDLMALARRFRVAMFVFVALMMMLVWQAGLHGSTARLR